jgi:hypothetical protein
LGNFQNGRQNLRDDFIGKVIAHSELLRAKAQQRRMWYEARANVTGVTARVKFPRMGVAESNK